MLLKKFNEFLANNSGVAGHLSSSLSEKHTLPVRHYFFQPLRSPADAVVKTLPIITAPLFLSIIAIQQLAVAAYLALAAIRDLLLLRPHRSVTAVVYSLYCVLNAANILIFATVSPLLNFVDTLGSVIATLSNTTMEQKQLEEQPSMPYSNV